VNTRAFVCAQCRTWFEGEGNSPDCPSCGKRASEDDVLEVRGDGQSTDESRRALQPATREGSSLSWILSAAAAVVALVGLAAAILADNKGDSGGDKIDIDSLFAPATRTPLDAVTVIAAFADAHSIPLTYVNDVRPEARYSAEELQVGSGGYVRIRMTIANQGSIPIELGASSAFGILTDGRGFHFSVYEGISLDDPDEGLPNSLAPGETWDGWVYLISYPPGVVFFVEGGEEFVLEISSERLFRFRQYIKLR